MGLEAFLAFLIVVVLPVVLSFALSFLWAFVDKNYLAKKNLVGKIALTLLSILMIPVFCIMNFSLAMFIANNIHPLYGKAFLLLSNSIKTSVVAIELTILVILIAAAIIIFLNLVWSKFSLKPHFDKKSFLIIYILSVILFLYLLFV